VEASNVGVKLGIVGNGIMDAVGISVAGSVLVVVGIGDGVAISIIGINVL